MFTLKACRYVPDLCVSLFSVVFMHFLIIIFLVLYLFYLYYTCCRPLWQSIGTFFMCFPCDSMTASEYNRQQRWIKRAIKVDEGGLLRHRKPCIDSSQMIKIII